MKQLKIYSWDDSVKSGFIHAVMLAIVCFTYTYISMFFTDGEEFIGKAREYEEINGFSFNASLIICGILAAMVPILNLRYSSAIYLIGFFIINIPSYILIVFLSLCLPMYAPFDYLNYAVSSIPIGMVVGTIVAVLINKKHKMDEN